VTFCGLFARILIVTSSIEPLGYFTRTFGTGKVKWKPQAQRKVPVPEARVGVVREQSTITQYLPDMPNEHMNK